MPYTLDEWQALSAQARQWAVEGLAKAKGVKVGARVRLDYRLIGTDVREGTVVGVRPNTSWDTPDRMYPDLAISVAVLVEASDGRQLEVNMREIVKVERV